MITKLKALWALVKPRLAAFWDNARLFIIAIGALIFALEYTKLKEYFLVKGGQKEIANATKQDATLANTETQDNNAANALIQQAQQLPTTEKPITPDWYEKK